MKHGLLDYTEIDYADPSWTGFSPVCFLPSLLLDSFKADFAADPDFAVLGSLQRTGLMESMLVILFDVCRGLSEKFKDDCIAGVDTHEHSWYCNVSSTLLRRRAGTIYPSCVRWLCSHGFIAHSDSYHSATPDCAGKSKAYWLGNRYAEYYLRYLWTRWKSKCGSGKHPVGCLRKYKFKSLYTKRRLYLDAVRRKEYLKGQEDIARMYEDLGHFKVDGAKARETMETLAAEGRVPPERVDGEMDKVERFGRMGDDPIAAYVVRDRYGRVHTNVTSLKKEIRENCMTCDGGPVGSVDIRSSQAAFLCSVFGMWLRVASDPLSVEAPRFVKLEPFWRDYDRDEVARRMSSELDAFKTLLRSGRMYEHFAEVIGVDDRSLVKKEWLAFLYAPIVFDKEAHGTRYAIRRAWKREFPTLLGCIDAMKRGNYAALSHEMQATESEFVFRDVVPLIRLFVGCPVCTVHDELIVPAECAGLVKEIMDTELERAGVPTMTVAEMDIIRPTQDTARRAERIREAMGRYYAGLSTELIDPRSMAQKKGSRLSAAPEETVATV